ncbi:MAG: fluoride efflux transporter CrcB [Alphaproteobacteria bacterium]
MPGLFLIFLGGGTGAVCRFALNNLVGRVIGTEFPFGTLIVNLLGALLIGGIVETMAMKLSAPGEIRLLLVTGFLGGFTTFSAFSLEAAHMFERGDFLHLTCYVAASVIGTIALVFLGSWMIRLTL